MSEKEYFYITTTLPYINSEPHIGFAAEIIKADVIARYQRQQGKHVFFNTGTDEHGLKVYQKAQAEGLSVAEYCDKYSAKFKPLKEKLNLSYNKFIRTTDASHQAAVQEFWRRCFNQGDIYKKKYEVKYCVGCEMEKTDSELENGFCPLHPGQKLELIAEENYFFRFSKYQKQLLALYKQDNFIIPASRQKEINNFVASGLKDFSISRQREKMPHGVPVPNDDSQVVYVWFDALVNYISTLGWPQTESNFAKYWPAVQVCGKDNLRPQAAMWQAMLMSAGIKPSKQILVFGFLTNNGQKIGKSLGNTIDPYSLVEKYGSDALRYYLLAEISTFADGDYSEDKFITRYNADLANGLGNLVARVANLLEKNEIKTKLKPDLTFTDIKKTVTLFEKSMANYHFNEALQIIWEKISELNESLSTQAPWKLEDRAAIASVLIPLAQDIINLAYLLEPFIPLTAVKINTQFQMNQIKKGEALFPRLN
ncbi:MAG: methionyl-tRNA synthetase [Patescibacteria group bacterium]|nr:methionyl-tRNA synthetase [Patescibacteria group bacterium]